MNEENNNKNMELKETINKKNYNRINSNFAMLLLFIGIPFFIIHIVFAKLFIEEIMLGFLLSLTLFLILFLFVAERYWNKAGYTWENRQKWNKEDKIRRVKKEYEEKIKIINKK